MAIMAGRKENAERAMKAGRKLSYEKMKPQLMAKASWPLKALSAA